MFVWVYIKIDWLIDWLIDYNKGVNLLASISTSRASFLHGQYLIQGKWQLTFCFRSFLNWYLVVGWSIARQDLGTSSRFFSKFMMSMSLCPVYMGVPTLSPRDLLVLAINSQARELSVLESYIIRECKK